MKNPKNTARVVVVSGDVTIDWNLARSRNLQDGGVAWNAEDCTRAYWQRGGAAMLGDLIEVVAQQLRKSEKAHFEVRQMAGPRLSVDPADPRHHHSYAMWKLFNYGEQARFDKEKRVWRVYEFLGLDRCPDGESESDQERVASDDAQADLIILDDANLGFRDDKKLWPKS